MKKTTKIVNPACSLFALQRRYHNATDTIEAIMDIIPADTCRRSSDVIMVGEFGKRHLKGDTMVCWMGVKWPSGCAGLSLSKLNRIVFFVTEDYYYVGICRGDDAVEFEILDSDSDSVNFRIEGSWVFLGKYSSAYDDDAVRLIKKYPPFSELFMFFDEDWRRSLGANLADYLNNSCKEAVQYCLTSE